MLALMKFRDFVWSKNPEELTVSVTRDIKELPLPFHGSVMQDYGAQKRIIKGEGEFCGKRCMDTYQRLADLFAQGESGVLILPGFSPMRAKPVSLSCEAVTRPDMLRYAFTFWEEKENTAAAPTVLFHEQTAVTADGESLWTIARRAHTTVETLLRLNPHIAWPGYLTEGLQVVLP